MSTTSTATTKDRTRSNTHSPSKSPPDELNFTHGAKSFNPFEKLGHPKGRKNKHQRDSLAYAIDNDLVEQERLAKFREQREWFFRSDDGHAHSALSQELKVYDGMRANDGIVEETEAADLAAKRYRDRTRCPRCYTAFGDCDCIQRAMFEPVNDLK